MSACSRGLCDGSGVISVCVEPMAGLHGYEQSDCPCMNDRDTSPGDAPVFDEKDITHESY